MSASASSLDRALSGRVRHGLVLVVGTGAHTVAAVRRSKGECAVCGLAVTRIGWVRGLNEIRGK